MEHIRQAIERARTSGGGGTNRRDYAAWSSPRTLIEPRFGVEKPIEWEGQQIDLDVRHLESRRIIAHNDSDPRSKSFDMLRTQVLQSMDQKNWKILGITSPTPGCGKTVTAINLAFSIARQPERSVLLIDLDLQKPHVASCIGVKCSTGLISVLEGQTSLKNAVIKTRVGKCLIPVLLAESSASGSSAWMASRAMSTMLQEIKRDCRSHIVVLDLPPMLSSDDVIALLPQLDCVMLVAAVGRSKVSEVEECAAHLQSADVVRLVLNKVPGLNAKYYPSRP
jgi:protein-tyrosine kinase